MGILLGAVGGSAVEREAMVHDHIWECSFLSFHLPLLHYNTPDTATCAATSTLSTTRNHCPPERPLWPLTFISLSPSMDTGERRKLLDENHKATLALVVCCLFLLVFILQSYGVHNLAFIKLKLPTERFCEVIYSLMKYEPVL